MKKQTHHKLSLSQDEVKEAVREYINLHSIGEMTMPDDFSIYSVLEGGARYSVFGIDAEIFE